MSIGMWIGVGTCLLTLVMGIVLYTGRGAWLIAGYNMMSPKEKAMFDEKALCRFAGSLVIAISILMGVMLALVERLPWVGWVATALTLVIVICSVVYANTGRRFQKKEGE